MSTFIKTKTAAFAFASLLLLTVASSVSAAEISRQCHAVFRDQTKLQSNKPAEVLDFLNQRARDLELKWSSGHDSDLVLAGLSKTELDRLSRPTSRARLENLLAKIDTSANPRSWTDRSRNSFSLESAVRRRVEKDLLAEDLMSALKNLGLGKSETKSVYERLVLSGAYKLAVSSSLNLAYWIAAKGIIGIPLPFAVPIGFQIEVEELKPIMPSLREKALLNGFDSVRIEFMSHFRNSILAGKAWRLARNIFISTVLFTLANQTLDLLPWANSAIATMTEDPKIVEQERSLDDFAQVREEMYSQWLDWYRLTYQSEPDPITALNKQRQISLIPNENLK